MKVMEKYTGRLNIVEFFDNGVIRKTSFREEKSRPSRLLREALVLETARSRGLLVPELLAYGRDNIGREYLEINIILGTSGLSMANGEKREVFTTIGSQLLRLGGCFDGYGWLNGMTKRGEYASWRQFLNDFYERYSARIIGYDLLNTLRCCKISHLIQEVISEPFEPYIIHRDIKPKNIIKDTRGATWILDWENALLGDPLFDIAQFAANFGHGKLWQALVRGYGLDVTSHGYALYEVIALTGVIGFCQQYNVSLPRRQERLKTRLVQLQSHP